MKYLKDCTMDENLENIYIDNGWKLLGDIVLNFPITCVKGDRVVLGSYVKDL
jgi:hypothetical protein